MASVTDGSSTIGRGSQRRGKTMRVSDFVSSSFDRFDQQYNTACSRTMTSNGPSSTSTNSSASHVLTAEEQPVATDRSRRSGHTNGDAASEDLVPMSFAHSILLDLLRRSNNDLQNYGGNTNLPLLLIALARVVIALLSLLLSICGIVLHVLLAVTIRILFVVVDGVSFVQRVLWRIVERVVTMIAIRMHWQQIDRSCNHHDNRRNGHNHSNNSSHDTDTHGEERRDGGGRIFRILESYRKHIQHQLLSLITPSTTTRNKLDTLPDIMINTPPSLSLFALVTALAFIVHPDGLTWIVLGKLCEGVWLGFKLLRGAATAIVAAMLSTSIEDGGGGGSSTIGSEALSTIVASAVLASLIMLGKVMYRALYKKNSVIDAQATSTSSSSSKKKKGRRGRNSGRHGNHHNRSGHRNNRKDATSDSSRTDSSSLPTHHHSKQQQQQQPLRARSRSLSPFTARTDSTTSFVEEKETRTKPKVGGRDNNNEATNKESKENDKMDSVSLTDSSNSGNGKLSSLQQLPHDPARDILSKLRPDSTDSLSVPQLSDEDVSLGSSVAGSLVVDCGPKQGGSTNRGGNSGSSNKTTKKRGGTRGKYHGGGPASTSNGMVRTPPGFVSKDSSSSSTKSSSLTRHAAVNSKAYSGKNSSSYERNDDRKQKQQFFPKKKSCDMNHQQRGTRMRASTSDCVIREHEVHSPPLLSGNNGTVPTDKLASPSASSMLSSGQHQLQPAQRVRVSSTNELTSPYRLGNQISQESSLLNNVAMMSNNLNTPISPPVIRPPPGLGFGNPVEMNSVGHGGVGGVELAPVNNNAVPGPTLSLSSPGRHQSQTQVRQYSSYDQSNFLLQPSVFPSMSNHHKVKEATSEDDRIDADLQQLGDQMVGSVLDF
eukprot:scaffold1089_cov131-Skeletonema_menzelii.AAC.12